MITPIDLPFASFPRKQESSAGFRHAIQGFQSFLDSGFRRNDETPVFNIW